MHFIDAHAHLNAEQFTNDWRDIAQTARDAGCLAIINNAGNLAEAERGVMQAEAVDNMYATVGIHPEDVTTVQRGLTADDLHNIRRLTSRPKVVAIGEIGLDYSHDPRTSPRDAQLDLLRPQIELALDLDLPVVIHIRDATPYLDTSDAQAMTDLLALLAEYRDLRGQIHCWTGTARQAAHILDHGFSLSFGGILTYPTSGPITEAAALIPDDRLLLETDAPYLVPEPKRRELSHAKGSDRRNHPEYAIMTAEKLASIRGTTVESIASCTTANAITLFHLPLSPSDPVTP